jgi:hypothetical protein
MTHRYKVAALAAVAGILIMIPTTQAGEGMWLFSNPPKKLLKEKYGFDKDPAWYVHVMKSSVRFNSGGSGSFVSPDGLVMTNHHVGADALQKMSNESRDYLKEGFHAKTRDQEKKCVDLELNVLQEIIDVTEKVNAAVKPEMKPAEAFGARRAVIAQIEKESEDQTKLRSNVITLYQGGQYHLYRFKRYTDVRLVFAPEKQIAFFGGDPDNFEYPRFDLDMCFFRVYEDGKPIKCEHFLKWSKAGAKDGELVFVSGHPGRTNRQNTMAELEYLRDFGYPFLLQRLYRMEVNLAAWGARSAENRRRSEEELFSIQNSRKARDGGLGGLMDPALMARKVSEENRLKAAVAADPKLKDVADTWDQIAAAEKKRREIAKEFLLLEAGSAFHSTLFGIGRTLYRAADEKPKPNGERLREFVDSSLKSLELQLFSEEPIYEDLEIVNLADSLRLLAEQFGVSSEIARTVLAGKSPRERAAELVNGSKLKDVELRKKLYEGGKTAIEACDDPMIKLAAAVDAEARRVRKIMETEVDEVKRQAHARISKAKYAIDGDSVYPDATFTLRLSYGVVKGYEENGKQVPATTTFAGLYERNKSQKNKEPFDLPQRWIDRKDKLDLSTPFNFVCTCDIIGGNSGSPVINAEGEVVGLIFDGNIQSLVLDFIYDETIARALSVHSQGIIEALRKVYDADDLADELTGARGASK